MDLEIKILAETSEKQETISKDLNRIFSELKKTEHEFFVNIGEEGTVFLVSDLLPNLTEVLESLDRKHHAILLVTEQENFLPPVFVEGLVDDVLVTPFRTAEVFSKLKLFERISLMNELTELSSGFTDLVDKIKKDLNLAERLQKSRFPERFSNVNGLDVHSRYLAGKRSGGDYFDLIEAPRTGEVSVFLSDSSSYGLSSAVLGVLLSAAVRLASGRISSSDEFVSAVLSELKSMMEEKEELSLFHGIFSKNDLIFRYNCLGQIAVLHQSDGKVKLCKTNSERISKQSSPKLKEVSLNCKPGDRIALISDGFLEACGSEKDIIEIIESGTEKQSKDLLNELVYRVKSKFKDENDRAPQDCSALVIEVRNPGLRIAKQKAN